MFDDEASLLLLLREGKIPPIWIDCFQCSAWSGALENIDFKDDWFTIYLEESPIKNPSHNPSVGTENDNKALTLTQYESHVQ